MDCTIAVFGEMADYAKQDLIRDADSYKLLNESQLTIKYTPLPNE